MGNVQVTVQNLEIVRVDTENNLLLVKGAVPGPKKSMVTINSLPSFRYSKWIVRRSLCNAGNLCKFTWLVYGENRC